MHPCLRQSANAKHLSRNSFIFGENKAKPSLSAAFVLESPHYVSRINQHILCPHFMSREKKLSIFVYVQPVPQATLTPIVFPRPENTTSPYSVGNGTTVSVS